MVPLGEPKQRCGRRRQERDGLREAAGRFLVAILRPEGDSQQVQGIGIIRQFEQGRPEEPFRLRCPARPQLGRTFHQGVCHDCGSLSVRPGRAEVPFDESPAALRVKTGGRASYLTGAVPQKVASRNGW